MNIIDSLKSIFRRKRTDPFEGREVTVSLAYLAFDVVFEQYKKCVDKVKSFSARVNQAACDGKRFTDFELEPAAFLNAHIDAINDVTTVMNTLVDDFLTLPRHARRKSAPRGQAASDAYGIYLDHVLAFLKAAKSTNIASADGIIKATKLEFDALIEEVGGSTEVAAGLREKACDDKSIAESLGAKVTEALERSSVVSAKAARVFS